MGRPLVWVDRVDGVHRARLDGLRGVHPLAMLSGNMFADFFVELIWIRCLFGRDDIGHGSVMLEAGFFDLKRNRHAEDRAAMLDRDDPAGRKAASIADTVDFIEDRNLGIARAEKITLERMNVAIFDRAIRGDQGLADDLPTEYALGAFLGASPSEKVELDLFEIKKIEEGLQGSRQLELRRSGTRREAGSVPDPGRSPTHVIFRPIAETIDLIQR